MPKLKSHSWWELIKFIINFFRGRRRSSEEKDKQRLLKIRQELQNDYDKIDRKKESKKNKSIEDRLDNMF